MMFKHVMGTDMNKSVSGRSTTKAWIIGLVPLFPLLYLASLATLRNVFRLPQWVILSLGVFATMQMLSVVWSPFPLEGFFFTALRTTLIVALVVAGYQLRDTRWLTYLMFGQAASLVVAMVFTASQHGLDVLNMRLVHPFYYAVGLGLMATIGLLITLESRLSRWPKLALCLLFVSGVLLSGTRSAMAASILGSLVLILQRLDFKRLLGFGLVLTAMTTVMLSIPNSIIGRRIKDGFGLSGRDLIWSDVLSAFKNHPWGGVGTFRVGYHIPHALGVSLPKDCSAALGMPCSDLIDRVWHAALIAHNLWLHSLTENGILGTIGLMTLLCAGAYAVFRAKSALISSLFIAYMAISLVDNPTAVPGLHIGETFYVVLGMAFAQAAKNREPQAGGSSTPKPTQ
ncbi:MAG: O-antigen ligase family protein [Deinococcaceae bacterium]